jgi:tetratricopeptide (TPR) repeat protein
LAFAHRSVSIFGGNQQEEYLKSKQAVERALELDNNLAAAHTILGEIEFSYEWKFPEAEKELRHAIELDPNSAFAHRFYAIYLSDMGRFDESVAEIKTAIDIDPNSNWNQRIFGFILFFARRYDEAITQLMRAAEMDSNQGANYGWLSVAFEQKGDYEHAFEYYVLAMEKWGATAGELDTWKSTYAKSGWQGILRRRLDQAKQAQTNSDRSDFGEAATLSAKLGEKEQAFAYLEKLFEKRDVSILWLLSNPDYDSLRSDPRLDELAARIGLNKK